MKKYLLLIIEGVAWKKMSPQEMQAGVQKHMDWSRELKESGRLVDADGMQPDGKILRTSGDSVEVVDGPVSGVSTGVGGYYIYNAKDWDEAVMIAKKCPSLEFGDHIEVLEVMDYS